MKHKYFFLLQSPMCGKSGHQMFLNGLERSRSVGTDNFAEKQIKVFALQSDTLFFSIVLHLGNNSWTHSLPVLVWWYMWRESERFKEGLVPVIWNICTGFDIYIVLYIIYINDQLLCNKSSQV